MADTIQQQQQQLAETQPQTTQVAFQTPAATMIPHPPPPRKYNGSTNNQKKQKKQKKTTPFVSGTMTFVPGGVNNVGTSTRTWLMGLQKPIDPSTYSFGLGNIPATASTAGATAGSSSFAASSNVRKAIFLNTNSVARANDVPIMGYTGHIPGYNHSSKANSGACFHEAIDTCLKESIVYNTTYNTPQAAASTAGGMKIGIPPLSARGWQPFQSTSRSDYVNHRDPTQSISTNVFYPDDRVASLAAGIGRASVSSASQRSQQHNNSRPPSTHRPTTTTASPRSFVKTARILDWVNESSPLSRTALEVITIFRSKIRSRIGSGGEIRFGFNHFAKGSMYITFDQWCEGFELFGISGLMKKSEAKAGFDLVDRNHDGKIDFDEFIRYGLGRSKGGTDSERTSELAELALTTMIEGGVYLD